MSLFDLARIRQELEGAPPEAAYDAELAAAVVSDVFRDATVTPPPPSAWQALAARGTRAEHRPGQLAALARILTTTGLRDATIQALRARPPGDTTALLEGFLEAIWPLTAELILGNAFRQEELLRRWIETCGGTIAGEDPAESRRRLEQLDYRRTLAAVEKAEKARLSEAAARAEALRKARAEAEEAARGWRE